MATMNGPLELPDQIIREWEESVSARSSTRTVILEERSFIWRDNHYKDETGPDRDQRKLRPRGQQAFDKQRHKKGRIAASKMSVDVRPDGPGTTPEQDEVATAVIEGMLFDPLYKRNRRRVIQSALGARIGAMSWAVCYDPTGKPKVYPQLEDALNWHWDAGYMDPDHPECPWVTVERAFPVRQVKALKQYEGWTIPADLAADDETPEGDGTQTRDDQASTSSSGSAQGSMTMYAPKGTVRLLFSYRKPEPTEPSGPVKELKPGEQYLACPGCGYRSDVTGKQPEAAGTCPDCGMPTTRVERENVPPSVAPDYTCRLVVVRVRTKEKFFDGPDPYAARGLNLLWLPCYEVPFAQIGTCDTTKDRDPQCVLNALDRKAYMTAIRSPSILITTDDLTQPNSRDPLEITDDPVQLAVWRGQGAPAVQFFKPEPVSQSIVGFRQMLANDLRSTAGTSDIGLKGQDLKSVTATTAQIAYETGEIPVDDHIAELMEREGMFAGVGFDIWRAVNRKRALVAVPTNEGRTEWVNIRGSDLPSYTFTVSTGPEWKAMDAMRGQVAEKIMAAPPEYRAVLADIYGFPVSVVRKLEKATAAAQRAAQPPEGGAGMGASATPGGGGLPVAGPPQPPGPMNGNGAMPQAVAARMQGMAAA